MLKSVNRYLNDVRRYIRLDKGAESEVMRELETHIEDRVSEMRDAGLSEEDATRDCIKLLGSARLVARQIYEAHSQGSWRQALLASMPHLLVAGLFALNWWQGVGWLAIMLGLVIGTVWYGWLHGRPVWLFPWLGYMLVPVLGAGLLLMYLPRGWSWLALVAYVPLAVWLILLVLMQAMKRDWQYVALMLFPVPIAIAWLLVVARGGWFLDSNLKQLSELANWVGFSFAAVAATATVFVRTRQRWLRISLLLVSGVAILTAIATHAGGGLDFPTLLLLALITVGLLFSPALVERRLRSRDYGVRLHDGQGVADMDGGR